MVRHFSACPGMYMCPLRNVVGAPGTRTRACIKSGSSLVHFTSGPVHYYRALHVDGRNLKAT